MHHIVARFTFMQKRREDGARCHLGHDRAETRLPFGPVVQRRIVLFLFPDPEIKPFVAFCKAQLEHVVTTWW